MSEFRFDDVIVAANAGDMQAYLADAHGEKVRPLCMCTPVGVPMYVAKVGEHYVIKRMPNTGGAHAPDCASYEPPAELSGLGEVKGEAIQESIDDGITTLRLDFSLSKTGGKRAGTLGCGGRHGAHRRRKTDAAWHLALPLGRSWPESLVSRDGGKAQLVRRAQIPSAGCSRQGVQGRAAGAVAVCTGVVLVGACGRRAQRRIAHMAELVINKKARKLMIAIGEVKEIAESRYGFKIVAKHLPDFPFTLSEDLHRRLQKRFPNELALWDSIEDAHLVFIATFGLSPTGIASIETLEQYDG